MIRLWLSSALLLGLLTGCASGRIQPKRQLLLTLTPPELKAGSLVTVTAVPQPAAELLGVSGTVSIFGAPNLPFSYDENSRVWRFRTMIPAFVTIPPGHYEARAWGSTKDGQRYEGDTAVDVK